GDDGSLVITRTGRTPGCSRRSVGMAPTPGIVSSGINASTRSARTSDAGTMTSPSCTLVLAPASAVPFSTSVSEMRAYGKTCSIVPRTTCTAVTVGTWKVSAYTIGPGVGGSVGCGIHDVVG